MEIIYRKLRGCVVLPPEPGEIHIRPQAPEHLHRRDYANLVLEYGVQVFPRGTGETERVVVDADPTLDDLLAATFAIKSLTAEQLPKSCQPFARYAALMREGLQPSEIPLEASLEGIFLALRNAASGDLVDVAVGTRFSGDWLRMAGCILQAAESGVNPFTTPLFAKEPEFARERAFLRRDQEVYCQDVRRGERWEVMIPGGPPQGAALLLRQPKSLLFKYWSRREQGLLGSDANLLLAVTRAAGQWVFSTDPIQRLSLKSLAEALQCAEVAQDPSRATKDPWFDGKPFAHTLVAAPRSGTVLPDQKVLGIVKRWSGARTVNRSKAVRRAAVLVGAAALLIAAGLTWYYRFSHDQTRPAMETENRGLTIGEGLAVKGNLYLLAVGVSSYKDSRYNLKLARADAEKLAEVFQKQSRSLFEKINLTVLTDEKATRQEIIEAIDHLKVNQNDLVIVTVSGHGALNKNEDFYFLPHDYDESRKKSSGIPWGEFEILGKLPCRVFLVLDTCHAGKATMGLRGTPGEQKAALEKDVYKLQKTSPGMVIMAACLGSGTAHEKQEWGHGALTLALLEGLSGTHYYRAKTETQLPKGRGENRVISLHDLNVYVTSRVQELAGDHQAVVTNQTGDIALTKIFVASMDVGK